MSPTLTREHDFQADITAISRIPSIETLLEVVCRTTGLGFAAVARVTAERWITCAVRDEIGFGLAPGGELEVETTLCDEIRCERKAIVIDHVAMDPEYADHHTPRRYGFQSYISVPIYRANGDFFGTLCAIDPKPARLRESPAVGTLTLFAQLISLNLEAHDRELRRELELATERGQSALRERFIAVLGHDLRNPVGAIVTAGAVLQKQVSDPAQSRMTQIIQRSAGRIAELVDHLLDLARGRLGGGLPAVHAETSALEQNLQQVVQELRSTNSKRQIESTIHIDGPVVCDARRLEQMLSNLLSNAITHGAQDSAIQVNVQSNAQEFSLSVTNQGVTIPPEKLAAIFRPFEGTVAGGSHNLGLGLFICSEIAKAHLGTLTVTSADSSTTFAFRMSNAPDAVKARLAHLRQG